MPLGRSVRTHFTVGVASLAVRVDTDVAAELAVAKGRATVAGSDAEPFRDLDRLPLAGGRRTSLEDEGQSCHDDLEERNHCG